MKLYKNASGKTCIKMTKAEWTSIGNKQIKLAEGTKEQGDVVLRLLEMQTNLKIYHWQTTSFAQHQAFGNIYDALTDLIDEFVEIMIGRHGRPDTDGSIPIKNISGFKDCVKECIKFLEGLDSEFKNETDLLNLRDEMLGQMNKLEYLFTLK